MPVPEPQWHPVGGSAATPSNLTRRLLADAQAFARYLHGKEWGPKHDQAVEAFLKKHQID